MSTSKPVIYDFRNWTNDELTNLKKQVGVALKIQERLSASKLIVSYSIGERVFLSYSSKGKVFGTIVKINSYSIRVRFDHGKAETWPPRFLFKVGINDEVSENVIPFRQRRA